MTGHRIAAPTWTLALQIGLELVQLQELKQWENACKRWIQNAPDPAFMQTLLSVIILQY